MTRPSGSPGKPAKSRKRIAKTRKRAGAATRVSGASVTKAEVARLNAELGEARDRQAAAAEVLSLIADAPTDLFPVFERIVRNAARLCQSVLSAVYRTDGKHVHIAHDQFSPVSVTAVRNAYPAPLGCGMSPEVRRQVFDPFFTTRRDQGSTGLGLHIVYNIVTNRLGGRINLESRPGAGTKFRIVVPREAPLEAAAE
jgi:signal transduction histidine kinase